MTDSNYDQEQQELYTEFYNDYKDAAAQPERLAPGRYILEFPRTMVGTLTTDKRGRSGLEYNLGQARIVARENGEEVKGYINKFYRASTLPKGSQTWADATDILSMFGVDFKALKTPQDFNEAFANNVAGQRTPVAIRFEYRGYYKHPLTGNYVNLKSDDFLTSDGDYARVGYVIDGVFTLSPTFPDSIGKDDYKAQGAYAKQAGWQTVFANFEPGFRAFGVKV